MPFAWHLLVPYDMLGCLVTVTSWEGDLLSVELIRESVTSFRIWIPYYGRYTVRQISSHHVARRRGRPPPSCPLSTIKSCPSSSFIKCAPITRTSQLLPASRPFPVSKVPCCKSNNLQDGWKGLAIAFMFLSAWCSMERAFIVWLSATAFVCLLRPSF